MKATPPVGQSPSLRCRVAAPARGGHPRPQPPGIPRPAFPNIFSASPESSQRTARSLTSGRNLTPDIVPAGHISCNCGTGRANDTTTTSYPASTSALAIRGARVMFFIGLRETMQTTPLSGECAIVWFATATATGTPCLPDGIASGGVRLATRAMRKMARTSARTLYRSAAPPSCARVCLLTER